MAIKLLNKLSTFLILIFLYIYCDIVIGRQVGEFIFADEIWIEFMVYLF